MGTEKKLIETIKDDLKETQPKVSATYMQLIALFPLQPITTKHQHETSLKIIEKLITHINQSSHTDSGAELYLKTLSGLVHHYEKSQLKATYVSGAEMLAYLMELKGLNQSDLSKDLGGQSVVSKILRGERELNLRQIKALAKRFKVSPDVFIGGGS
jgi:HTH-type transcriptional regulator/antitoxin HigA